MANASRDQNDVPTMLGVLDSDGDTLVRIKIEPVTHAIKADDASTGTDRGPTIAPRDENFIPALLAVSSVDGVTPVVVYANSDGELLIDSN